MSKEKTISNTRKIIYACTFLAVVAVVATVIAVSTSDGGKTKVENKPITSVRDSASASERQSAKPSDEAPTSETAPSSADVTPTVKEISFVMPVEGGETIKDYTDATVVFNKTLGVYTGHLALDVAGAENAKVLAAEGGEVEAITTSYLEGTTLTINHGNGLKTVYNSIEVSDGLSVGNVVAKGSVIGIISTNNRQEYKDGPHLHFEVWENGLKISPYKYLNVNEK